MDELGDNVELTPSLLKFYRTRIHELQHAQSLSLLSRLKHLEFSNQERSALERELQDCQDELRSSQKEIQDLRAGLRRERMAVIELVQENAQLRGTNILRHRPFEINSL
jgi:predicted  nucleic acid-binding Zn-ribbon protein